MIKQFFFYDYMMMMVQYDKGGRKAGTIIFVESMPIESARGEMH
jgi:hypothetical protein